MIIERLRFIRTLLGRDIPQLGITIPSEQLYRFWLMVAHYHGQSWNASEIADLKLERLVVIYPGEKDYVLDDRVHVRGLRNVADLTGA